MFALGLALCVSVGSAAGASPIPKRVLAFYYPWYGTAEVSGQWMHWNDVQPEQQQIGSATNYPVGGAYDSGDVRLIDRHFLQMAEAGIDGAIVSWWGPKRRDSDRHMAKILAAAAKHRCVVSAYFEAVRSRSQPEESAADDLAYVIEQYGKHPAWLSVDGRPVIFVYIRALSQLLPLERWHRVRKLVKERTGQDPFLVGDQVSHAAADVFDGVHEYNPVGRLAGQSLETMRRVYRYSTMVSEQIAQESGKLACVTIIPGYDDTKIRDPGLSCARHGGQAYDLGWEEVVGSKIRWVLITSWNEWHEGSEIEPSVENGDRELQSTRRWVERFKDPGAQRAKLSPTASWRPFVSSWTGGTIAIVGAGPIGAEIALSGLPSRLVSLRGFCRGAVTAGDCPILVYTGGENFYASHADGATLQDALRRYAQAGGQVIWAGSQPWPLFRDQGTGDMAWSHHIGLPLSSGFEEPPMENLTFRFEGALTSFGSKPFPVKGDQRFRPCRPPAPDSAKFTPLATLRTPAGKSLGAGIAEIEYRPGHFGGARMIYVWFRMWDTVDREELLRAILRCCRQ